VTSHDWVLDTNVLISAALSRQGSPYVLVQRALAEARIVFSEPTFEELRGRLYRPKFDRYISLYMRERVLRDLSASAPWVEIDHQGRLELRPGRRQIHRHGPVGSWGSAGQR